jgi:ELWxxDGT repeat protein
VTKITVDLGPIDDPTHGGQQVAGDDMLTFLYTYHLDASGKSKHLYAYSPQSNTLTHLQDAALADGSSPMHIYGGQLYFTDSDPAHGANPWVSDGTVAGRHILVNLSNVAGNAGTTEEEEVVVLQRCWTCLCSEA